MSTPLMKQYYRIKEQHPDDIVFFHLGDFYEVFDEDAELVSRELDITLTSRFQGEDEVPMAGVPVQKSESYIKRLLQNGHRVAICDQVEDADEASGLVERDVVRVITPGTITEEEYLSEKKNNFLASIYLDEDEGGLAWADLSTGTFKLEKIPADALLDEISRIGPAECISSESLRHRSDDFFQAVEDAAGCMMTTVPEWTFELETAIDVLTDHFETTLLDGFGINEPGEGVRAAGALIEYLKETQKGKLDHIKRLTPHDRSGTMVLDKISQRSLELTETIRTGEEKGSLIHILDRTDTAMGGRLIRRWLLAPLTNPEEIKQRQGAVESLKNNYQMRNEIREQLKEVYDIERITSKLGSGRATPRDLVSLRTSLANLPPLLETLEPGTDLLDKVQNRVHPLTDLREELEEAIQDNPPSVLSDGGIFRDGYNEELDELRDLQESGKEWMAEFEQQEKEKTGIDNLKVGFNKVHGYYIEVTKAKTDRVPEEYDRKQTLKNAERYITPELKEKESQLLNAEEQAKDLEYNLFLELRTETAKQIDELQKTARALAELDTLVSLATVAEEKDWRKPEIVEEPLINVKEGRHPVVEEIQDERFVPNHTEMSVSDNRLLIITGPNMAGKSTYIRQVGLLCILAQMGSFIPARKGTIGIVDQIFTRVGASDELSRGASTFMVEMTETANILNNATRRSLVILDEVGRGTSTTDGVSIARAVCEHIHDRLGSRTLFATHYQELSVLEEELPGVKNYHFGASDREGDIVFQRKLKPGASDRSYGIHVANLAGIPEEVVRRAEMILKNLEDDRRNVDQRRSELSRAADRTQKNMFVSPEAEEKAEQLSEIEEVLSDVDINETPPIRALEILKEIKHQLGDGS